MNFLNIYHKLCQNIYKSKLEHILYNCINYFNVTCLTQIDSQWLSTDLGELSSACSASLKQIFSLKYNGTRFFFVQTLNIRRESLICKFMFVYLRLWYLILWIMDCFYDMILSSNSELC